jgi:hypothetical protein
MRCEDYPCCGHTDGLGCGYVPDMDAIYASISRGMDDDDYYVITRTRLTWMDVAMAAPLTTSVA